MKIFKTFALYLLTPALLFACSPQFNWREMGNPQAGYVATFPDKAALVTRNLNLIHLEVPLTMQAVEVGGLYFAVGSVPLTGDLADKAEPLRNALALSLAHNVHSDTSALIKKTFQGREAQWMDITGTTLKGEKIRAQAYFLVHHQHLLEIFLIGPAGKFTDDLSSRWFTGVSLSRG